MATSRRNKKAMEKLAAEAVEDKKEILAVLLWREREVILLNEVVAMQRIVIEEYKTKLKRYEK